MSSKIFENIATGTDIEEISRFCDKTSEKAKKFLEKIYTSKETEYCFSKTNYAQSLCARFCGKEAVIKALTDFGIRDVSYCDIEILNNETGMPCVSIKKYPYIQIKMSLSHCRTHAIANVILFRDELS